MTVDQQTAQRAAEFWIGMARECALNSPRPQPTAEEYTLKAIKNLMIASHGR
jgi:hypothetical protein